VVQTAFVFRLFIPCIPVNQSFNDLETGMEGMEGMKGIKKRSQCEHPGPVPQVNSLAGKSV
jgi:hypothetical protein